MFLNTVAIDLIVHHIQELLKNRNGNGGGGSHSHSPAAEAPPSAGAQMTDGPVKRNRHNSDSFFTRPH